jgi:hypothetical protein
VTPLQEAIRLVTAARTAGELFGTDQPVREFRRLARLTHPDRVPPADRAAATEAFTRLSVLWRSRTGVTIRTRRAEYRIGALAHRGDLANLYGAGDAMVKLVRDPAHNDLMSREARALRALEHHGDPRYLPYVPRLVESFRHRDAGTGVERRANVLATTVGGLRSLVEVRQAYPDGVDPRDAAWMARRLLVALGLAHRAGLVHGAVVPDHVLIQPDQHGLVLVDWCYATPPGEPVPAVVGRYRDWYPPEVTTAVGPGTDIAMAAHCMTYLMAGRIPDPLRAFADGCRLPRPRQRPDDAWRLLAELDEVLGRLYGPRVFRPFRL